MQLEQEPPNRPSFLTVVLIAGAAIIVIFVLAIFVLRFDGRRLTGEHYRRHPTSELVLPTMTTTREA